MYDKNRLLELNPTSQRWLYEEGVGDDSRGREVRLWSMTVNVFCVEDMKILTPTPLIMGKIK